MTYKDMTISQEKEIFVFRIKDFWSAVTHFIGMVVANITNQSSILSSIISFDDQLHDFYVKYDFIVWSLC